MATRRSTRGVRPARPAPTPGVIDTSAPHPARIYDYLLGGTDWFDVDRSAAAEVFAAFPGGLPGARANALANRRFLARVVQHLAADVGVRQFLDVGAGVPTANNVHQVAQRVAPESRAFYVDNDPIVLAHAHQFADGTPEGLSAFERGDLREPEAILTEAAKVLDLGKPVAIVLSGVLHFVSDDDGPYGAVRRLVDAVPSGSWLAVSHLAAEVMPDQVRKAAAALDPPMPGVLAPRDRDAVAGFFEGLVVDEPGVVPVDGWRPDVDESGVGPVPGLEVDASAPVAIHAALGHKP